MSDSSLKTDVVLESDLATGSSKMIHLLGSPVTDLVSRMQGRDDSKDRETERCVQFMLDWLLELKCPFTKIFYGRIKLYYYDQIQGIMGLRRHVAGDFVVRIPKYTVIQRYLLNMPYWTGVLKPRMLHWYMTVFVPRLVWKQMGRLEYGECEQVIHISSPSVTAASRKRRAEETTDDDAVDVGFNMGVLGEDMTITVRASSMGDDDDPSPADKSSSTASRARVQPGFATKKKPRFALKRQEPKVEFDFDMGGFA